MCAACTITSQVILADLVPEAAGPAVDHHGHLVEPKPERGGGLLVVDLRDVLDLGEVVAGPERAELRMAPLAGPIGHELGIRAREAAAFLDPVEILRSAKAPPDRPGGPALEHAREIVLRSVRSRRLDPTPAGTDWYIRVTRSRR